MIKRLGRTKISAPGLEWRNKRSNAANGQRFRIAPVLRAKVLRDARRKSMYAKELGAILQG
jgi:hypothetical protein